MFHVLPSNISVNIHTSTTEHAKYSFLEKPYISTKFSVSLLLGPTNYTMMCSSCTLFLHLTLIYNHA